MKRLTLLAAMAALGLGGAAAAQMTTQEQHVAPNGTVRTTTTHDGAMGTHSTTRVDRPDGSSRVIQRDDRMGEGHMGDGRGDRHMDGDMRMHGHGWHHRQMCKVTWHHGHRIRRCWNR